MKKFLLFCLFSLHHQLTQTGDWKKFGPRIRVADSAIDHLKINTYMSTPGQVYIAANQTGAERNFRVQSDHVGTLASRVVPISDDQLAVNRLRNPLVVLMVGRLSVTANSYHCSPGTILIEKLDQTGNPIERTEIPTEFDCDNHEGQLPVITSLDFDENGNFLCAGSRDGKLQLWKRTRVEADAQKSSSDLFEKPLNSKEKECPDER